MKSETKSAHKETEIEGTLFYLAPEVFAEKTFSKQSDGALCSAHYSFTETCTKYMRMACACMK